MHSSQNVDVYLDIRSNPIIEHSNGIRFAPYPSFLDASISPESVSRSNLSVQDFSHIRPTPSPNWSLLSKNDAEDARLTRMKELVSANEKDHQEDVSEVLGGILPSQTHTQ
jgi:tubulin-specific chaperone C